MSNISPDIKNVSGVQFSIASPEEIRSTSVIEITKYETYEKDIPVIKGLFDIRMGVTEGGVTCGTCGQRNTHCPGHFGHIELTRPIYNYHFIQTVLKLIKCVCYKCSKLLIDKDSDISNVISKKIPKQRWLDVYERCNKIKECGQDTIDGCGAKQPDNYKIEGITGINGIWKKTDDTEASKINFSGELMRSILERISDEDLYFMGFSEQWCRPEWLICSVLPVCHLR